MIPVNTRDTTQYQHAMLACAGVALAFTLQACTAPTSTDRAYEVPAPDKRASTRADFTAQPLADTLNGQVVTPTRVSAQELLKRYSTPDPRGTSRQSGIGDPQQTPHDGSPRVIVPGFDANVEDPNYPLKAPDTSIAVGPDHVINVTNFSISIYEKAAPQDLVYAAPLGLNGFFDPAGASLHEVFDPRCVYDDISERYYITAIEQDVNAYESWLYVAVSQTSDPDDGWYMYQIDTLRNPSPNGRGADQPIIGFDDTNIYIAYTISIIGSQGTLENSVTIFPKSVLLSGSSYTLDERVVNTQNSNLWYACMQASQPFDANEGGGIFASFPRIAFGSTLDPDHIRLWAFDNQSTPQLVSYDLPLGVTLLNPPRDMPIQNATANTQELINFDGRLMNLRLHNDQLYTTHSVQNPSSSSNSTDGVVRWYQIDLDGWPNSGNSPSLVQSGEIAGASGQHIFYPAIFTDENENVGMILGKTSASQYASVMSTTRLATDPLGKMNKPTQIVIGNSTPEEEIPANAISYRWGDYFDIGLDPEDNTTFWATGLYEIDHEWRAYIHSFKAVDTTCIADWDNNRQLNYADVVGFLADYNALDASADLNNDSVWDFNDVSIFMAAFNSGCS